jgi:hypothetical protein
MLRHASADVVASDHDWALVPERLEETYQAGGEMRHRSLAYRELTSGAPEAGESTATARTPAAAMPSSTGCQGLQDNIGQICIG